MANLYDVDWSDSMQQTYEFYVVDPVTWKDSRKLDLIESCRIERDASADTLGSASFTCSEVLPECYVRVYLSINQNNHEYKTCLGTFMVQTPGFSFDGKRKTMTMDGYTPLIELSNDYPPVGYSLLKEENIMNAVYHICGEHMRAPVIKANCDKTLASNFIANLDDTWMSFVVDLIANAKYRFAFDDMGRLIFEVIPEVSSLNPVWTFNDDNSSILLPSITNEEDLYSIPNVVEVIYSKDSGYLYSRVENIDENSKVSIPNRGRIVLHRENNPSFEGEPNQDYIDSYAKTLLKSLSSISKTLTYSHGYCPVKLNDCVLLNYKAAGINNVRAQVVSQSINCSTGCVVEETAVYTEALWKG